MLEKPSFDQKKSEKVERKRERGVFVGGAVVFIRHGVRETTGELKEVGRSRSAEVVSAEAHRAGSILNIIPDKIRVIGSTAGPANEITGEQRSLDTAHVAGDVLANFARDNASQFDGVGNPSPLLSYETLAIPSEEVYQHDQIYNAVYEAALAKGLDVHAAAQSAQDATMNAAFSAKSPLADQMRKETAGSFAVVLRQFKDKLRTAKSGTTVLMPAGVHGGTMEYLLQQALIWTDENGKVRGPGFEHIEDIGGAFAASESYAVEVDTDQAGNFNTMSVTFQDRARRKGIYNARLDQKIVDECEAFYVSLHEKMPETGLEKVSFE